MEFSSGPMREQRPRIGPRVNPGLVGVMWAQEGHAPSFRSGRLLLINISE